MLLRPSGTEPLVRVMVEAQDQGLAQETAGQLATVVGQALHSKCLPAVRPAGAVRARSARSCRPPGRGRF